MLLVGDASGSTIGSMDGGRTLLVTTRHGQTHRSGFLGVDTETGETRLLREEDKSYGNIFNTPFLSTDRKSVVKGKSLSVRVNLGGRRIIKQQKHIKQKVANHINNYKHYE